MINSRNINDLTPMMQMLATRFELACIMKNWPVLVTCTYRDNEYQDKLYAQGRTAPGAKVTNARGGQSAHNYRVAFDFVPLDAHHKPDWNNTKRFEEMGALGKSIGLEWGGDFKSIKDMPHFQLPGWTIPKAPK